MRRDEELGVLYFTPHDVLIPRVDRQCMLRFCEALAAREVAVEVVSLGIRLDYDEPTRSRSIADVYGIRTRFPIRILPCWARQRSGGPTVPAWRLVMYPAYLAWRLLRRHGAVGRPTVVLYFKNYLLGLPFLLARRLVRGRILLLFEIHLPPRRALQRALLRRFDGIVANSGALARALPDDLDGERILVAHQGVSLEAVEDARVDRAEARRLLGLPLDPRLVVYTGKVYDGMPEVDALLECAALLPDDAQLVVVGGREDHVARLRERVSREGVGNVRFVGFVAPADVFRYQMAGDVLVSYYPPDPLNDFRSPGKLFEYMASRTPIVMADYQGPREVLGSRAAVFVEPNDPGRLAEAVGRVLDDAELSAALASAAYEDVREHTWARRAERVCEFALRLAP